MVKPILERAGGPTLTAFHFLRPIGDTVSSRHCTFGTPSTKIFFLFFALIKKIFLQSPVEIIFRYHYKYFYIFGTPLQTKRTKVKISHMECWVSK